jgi:hypothetical protein
VPTSFMLLHFLAHERKGNKSAGAQRKTRLKKCKALKKKCEFTLSPPLSHHTEAMVPESKSTRQGENQGSRVRCMHVHGACLCCVALLLTHAACSCCMTVLKFLCFKSMLHVHIACLCYVSMLCIHSSCACYRSMLHVHAACP